ncbi:peroxiredoxin family protein [Priestia flexa]|uniref:peroxiredoxin family protein n=1 Tax=Priestia flexa TaxID=86664 RepID=UPI001B333728|nr:redoxin domain-containing protein [Priestia flexa]
MLKKVIAIFLLVGFAGFAAWQALAPKDDEGEKLSSYADLNIKEEQAEVTNGEPYGLEPGDQAPPFTLKDTEGKSVQLSDFKGKKVILNFWATWCPPCKEEMPAMQQFHDKSGKEVHILAVNLTSSEGSKQSVSNFLNENKLSFHVLLDEKDEVATKAYRVMTIPTSYFINEKGEIVKRINGPMTLQQMETFASESSS